MALSFGDNLLSQSDVRETVSNEVTASVNWNLAYSRYIQRFDTGLANELYGLYISPDGLHAYITRDAGANSYVYEYVMTTPWDVSTMAYVTVKDVTAQDTSMRGVSFNKDGTKMYVGGISDVDAIHEYDLTTAWDLSTASYLQEFALDNAYTAFFRPDGKQMIIPSGAGNLIYSYVLTTAWDVTTAVLINNIAYSAAIDVHFSSDGAYMFVIDDTTTIKRWALSTVYDVSTAAADSTSMIAPPGTRETGIFFNLNGTKMYLLIDAYIQEYTIKRGWK